MKADSHGFARVLQFPAMPKRITFDAPNRLRALRQARGFTLAQVAAAIGTTTAQYQRLETGARDLDVPWMVRIAKALECQPADLLLPEHGGLDPRERELVDTVREVPAPFSESIFRVAESHQSYRGGPEVEDMTRLLPRKA